MMMGVVVVDDDVFVGVDMTGPEGVYGGSNPLHARIDPKQSTKQMTNDKKTNTDKQTNRQTDKQTINMQVKKEVYRK